MADSPRPPHPRTVTSVIGGRPATDAPAGRGRSTNPAHLDEVVAEVALGDAAQFVAAARAARAAQQAWADVPAPVRGRAIAHIGRLVEDNKEALAALVTREIGKPYAEALGEVQEIVDTCDFFLGEGRRLYGQTVPSEMPDKQLFTFRNPVGTVAVITAGNFPVAVPSWYIVPALLCGNTVVWKPAEYSRGRRSRLPRAVLPGRRAARRGAQRGPRGRPGRRSPGLSRRWTRGLIDKVGFTGSSEVGARIGELTGRHLQSACLELGGKNPMVVDAQRRPRPRGRGRAVRRVRHRRAAVHLARHGDLPRVRARRVPHPVRRGDRRGQGRRPVRRTCCTGRCST